MVTRRASAPALSSMTKASGDSGGRGSARKESTRAAGGAPPRRRASKASSAPAGPKASTVTPERSLRTRPRTPQSRAARQTNGRMPTPCTVPPMRNRRPGFPFSMSRREEWPGSAEPSSAASGRQAHDLEDGHGRRERLALRRRAVDAPDDVHARHHPAEDRESLSVGIAPAAEVELR